VSVASDSPRRDHELLARAGRLIDSAGEPREDDRCPVEIAGERRRTIERGPDELRPHIACGVRERRVRAPGTRDDVSTLDLARE